jgi:hypothetical protein
MPQAIRTSLAYTRLPVDFLIPPVNYTPAISRSPPIPIFPQNPPSKETLDFEQAWRFRKPGGILKSRPLTLKSVAEEIKKFILDDLRGVRTKTDIYEHLKCKFFKFDPNMVRGKVRDVLMVLEGIGGLDIVGENVVKWRQTQLPSVIDPDWEWDAQYEDHMMTGDFPKTQPPTRPTTPVNSEKPKKRVRMEVDEEEKEQFRFLLCTPPTHEELAQWDMVTMEDFDF